MNRLLKESIEGQEPAAVRFNVREDGRGRIVHRPPATSAVLMLLLNSDGTTLLEDDGTGWRALIRVTNWGKGFEASLTEGAPMRIDEVLSEGDPRSRRESGR